MVTLVVATIVQLHPRFLGNSYCNLGFTPIVLKEIALLGNKMKLHPHFEIPNPTPESLRLQ